MSLLAVAFETPGQPKLVALSLGDRIRRTLELVAAAAAAAVDKGAAAAALACIYDCSTYFK